MHLQVVEAGGSVNQAQFKERGMLFSAPMVHALLAGTKTQTRRAIKSGFYQIDERDDGTLWPWRHDGAGGDEWLRCPYGQPGDKLWVREAFSGPHCMEKTSELPAMPPGQWPQESAIWYWADGEPDYGDWTRPRPSIHMPRWASRITLEIKGIRVERLQDVSDADALAEGVDRTNTSIGGYATERYRLLWESINGAGSWDANPWVWVIEFSPTPATKS